MKSYFLNDVFTVKGDFWNFTSFHIILVWCYWWYYMSCSLCIIFILKSFSFSASFKLKSNRLSNYLVSISKVIRLFVVMSILYVSSERKYLYLLQIHESTAWSDELLIVLTGMKIYLGKLYQNFPAGFVPCIGLMAWIYICFWFLGANEFLDILFWTITGRDVVH